MTKPFKSLLRDLWTSLGHEREVNLFLMASYWPPSEEVEKLLPQAHPKSPPLTIWERISRNSRLPTAYESFLRNLESAINSLIKSEAELVVIKRVFRTKTRIIVGFGPSGWDISLIHMLKPYGVPWIPGSSLKGAMESAAQEELMKVVGNNSELKNVIHKYKEHRLEDLTGKIKTLAELFGTKYFRGRLIVLGGFINSVPSGGYMTVDVISPHYKRYYESKGEVPPSESMVPVPIKFPAVREGTQFTFILLMPNRKNYVEFVSEILEKTLTKYGIGGKTSAGYGLFEKAKAD